MKPIQIDKNLRILIVFITFSVFFVFATGFSKYIFAKDYYFIIEAPCDQNSKWCYSRSCDDFCPPNGLEEYHVFKLKASYFDQCNDNSCKNLCYTGADLNICRPIPCNTSEDQQCIGVE